MNKWFAWASYKNLLEYSSKAVELIKLTWLNLVVLVRSFLEFLKTAFCYYTNLDFFKVDFFLLLTYLFHNPFEISKRFLEQKGEKDLYTYGETPLTTLDLILQKSQINRTDVFMELGSGRGRNCFWVNAFKDCKVIGIEYIPEFVQRANRIVSKFDLQNMEFRCEDFLKTDFSEATVIYLYGTCLGDSSIKTLTEHFKKMRGGSKIITISYPLSDPAFEVMNCFPARFTWGQADVYLHVKKH